MINENKIFKWKVALVRIIFMNKKSKQQIEIFHGKYDDDVVYQFMVPFWRP